MDGDGSKMLAYLVCSQEGLTCMERHWLQVMAKEAMAWRDWHENCGVESCECSDECSRAHILDTAVAESNAVLGDMLAWNKSKANIGPFGYEGS